MPPRFVFPLLTHSTGLYQSEFPKKLIHELQGAALVAAPEHVHVVQVVVKFVEQGPLFMAVSRRPLVVIRFVEIPRETTEHGSDTEVRLYGTHQGDVQRQERCTDQGNTLAKSSTQTALWIFSARVPI